MKIHYSHEVRTALKEKNPVLALESTIISHGMPFPQNLEFASRAESMCRDQGVVPATIAIIKGKIYAGLDKNQIEFNQYVYCAIPKFSKEWTKLFIKKSKKKIKYRATVFYKTLETDYAYDKKKYLNQLQAIIFLLKKYKFSINFNLHPLAKKGFETYFNNNEFRNFKISKNNITQDIYDSDLLLFKYATNSILDCIAYNKYPIELWSLKNKKYFTPSIYSKKKLTLKCNNAEQLENYIKDFFKKKKYPKIDMQRKKYFFDNNKTKSVIKKIKKFILS